MRTWIRVGAVVLVLIGLAAVPAIAGKGGNGGGKPGGGGGSALPPVEVVFLARAEGTNIINGGYDVYVATADQTSMRRVTPDLNLGTTFILDITGDFAFTDGFGTPRTTDLETDETGTSPLQWNGQPQLTSFRNASGLLPISEQRAFGQETFDTDVVNVANGQTVTTRNLVLRAFDGSADWLLTDNDHSWDPGTGIFVRRESHAHTLLTDQPGYLGIAWALYTQQTRTYEYDEATSTWTTISDLQDLRIKTLDLSDPTAGCEEVSDVSVADGIPPSEAIDLFTPPTRITPNGRWMTITRDSQAYLVPIAYDSGLPEFREPTASDFVPVIVPDGYEPVVEIAGASPDGAFVALLLTRIERRKGNEKPVRHLFVARSDGTDLTQIDIGTDGFDFEYTKGTDNFPGVGFRPYTP